MYLLYRELIRQQICELSEVAPRKHVVAKDEWTAAIEG